MRRDEDLYRASKGRLVGKVMGRSGGSTPRGMARWRPMGMDYHGERRVKTVIIISQHHMKRETSTTAGGIIIIIIIITLIIIIIMQATKQAKRIKLAETRANRGMTPIPGSSIVEGSQCFGQPRPSLEQPGEME